MRDTSECPAVRAWLEVPGPDLFTEGVKVKLYGVGKGEGTGTGTYGTWGKIKVQ